MSTEVKKNSPLYSLTSSSLLFKMLSKDSPWIILPLDNSILATLPINKNPPERRVFADYSLKAKGLKESARSH
jgi:hypothetical protein